MKIPWSVVSISLLGPALVFGQPGRGEAPGWRGDQPGKPAMTRLADDPDLTPQQRQALRQLRQNWQEQEVDLRGDVQKARLAVRKQMAEPTVNRAALMAAVEAESTAELALRKARMEHMLEMREIVGPEKARRMLKAAREDRPGGLERRGPRGE
ncbi:MAG TPA: periplasmic heavy metal sensor [Kiritimatiellia bacterium]|nr:periplasmic heavy metal sensor [Kiritimatiellia bacterium]HMO99573.1 periplasmic heavy metal sensor [Kiritimatiellia bacterium]HMP97552.1 periplasmic heavy metal sensor [Kiritimatiellia bacterium]